MNLFQISAEIEAILADVREEGGEITPEQIAALDALEMGREQKLLDYGCVIRGLDCESEAIGIALKELRDRKAKVDAAAERLKRIVSERLGEGNKLKDGRVSLFWRGSSAVEVESVYDLPETFWRPRDPEADKTKLKEALQRGEQIPGARIVERQHLQVK